MSFRFKQFFIEDSKCAMKVGTDGVLLGAWAPITNYQSPITNTLFRVLDVGTGSGLIARMLMQRCPEAEVEGIDIDEAAVEQARENGVKTYCAKLQDWQGTYDLIVSNPPYFQNSLKNPDTGRMTARHTDTLSYTDLIHHCARLLKEDGQLALILPADAETEVRGLAAAERLSLTHVTHVYSKEGKPAKRVLLAFSRDSGIPDYRYTEDTLVLEDEKGGRSAAYSDLTRDFYL
ncbi:MAG: methyltransferase [Paludibacteraceae bacterium]|nr:methyltransferase [Paludibacteraceae bacterium]